MKVLIEINGNLNTNFIETIQMNQMEIILLENLKILN